MHTVLAQRLPPEENSILKIIIKNSTTVTDNLQVIYRRCLKEQVCVGESGFSFNTDPTLLTKSLMPHVEHRHNPRGLNFILCFITKL